jgi:cytochrome b561
MLKNKKDSYGLVAILLHWLSAIIIFGLFGLGYWMVDLNYYSEWYKTAPMIHKSIGMILFVIILFRLFWKVVNIKPIAIGNKFEIKISKIVHFVLYLLMLVIFISGYLISTGDGRGIEIFNLFTIPAFNELIENQETIMGVIHKYSTYSLMFLVTLHALAAIKHHFINKDNILKRIIKPNIKG